MTSVDLYIEERLSSRVLLFLEPWTVSLLQVNKMTTSVLDISFQLFGVLTPVLEF